jgi:hypothetical protein
MFSIFVLGDASIHDQLQYSLKIYLLISRHAPS